MSKLVADGRIYYTEYGDAVFKPAPSGKVSVLQLDWQLSKGREQLHANTVLHGKPKA